MKSLFNELKRKEKLNWRLSLVGVGGILVLLYLLIMRYHDDFVFLLRLGENPSRLEQMFRAPTLFDYLLLLSLTALMSAVPFFSSSVICIANGLIFGPIIGLVVNIFGGMLGNFLSLQILKQTHLAQNSRRSGHVVDDLSHFKNPVLGLSLGYMVPVIPTFLVNYTAINLKLSRKEILSAMFLGMLPASALYAYGGDALFKGNKEQLLAIIGIVVAFALLYQLIRNKRMKKGKK